VEGLKDVRLDALDREEGDAVALVAALVDAESAILLIMF
jgi:hypothetical protein